MLKFLKKIYPYLGSPNIYSRKLSPQLCSSSYQLQKWLSLVMYASITQLQRGCIRPQIKTEINYAEIAPKKIPYFRLLQHRSCCRSCYRQLHMLPSRHKSKTPLLKCFFTQKPPAQLGSLSQAAVKDRRGQFRSYSATPH